MDSQSQLTLSSVPSISLLVNAVSADAKVSETAATISKLGLASTWIVDQPRQAKVLANSLEGFELAAAASARSPQRLRTELANLQAGLQAITGSTVSVIAGDPQELRSRAALLADLAISAVVPTLPLEGRSSASQAKPPRQLPCGLWQFDPTVSLPRARSRWSFLPTRRPSLSQLRSAGATSLAALDLAQASSHDVQSYLKLLQEVAVSSQQQEIKVVAVGQLANALSAQHEVKPQRSILRRAA